MIDPPTLLAAAAALFGVECEAIVAHAGRGKRLTQARQAVAYILRAADYSLMEIGAVLRRDHTTIIYSVRQAKRRADADEAYAAKLRALEAAAGVARVTQTRSMPCRPKEIDWRHWWTHYALAGHSRPKTA